MTKRKIISIFLISFIIILSSIILSKYLKSFKTIKIGLTTDLSGKNSELGISARNALDLGIKEINADGGLNGTLLELLVEDNEGSTELCILKTDSLVKSGVDVIISPIISGMASSVIKGVADNNILVIGPTVSSDDLIHLDDNFFSLSAPASLQGIYIAKVSEKNLDKKVVVIIDEKNRAYSYGAYNGFQENLDKSIQIEKIIFKEELDLIYIVSKLKDINPDGIFFLANGIDSANIIQLLAKESTLPNLYGGSWVKVSEINKFGGRRVEGMILVDNYFNNEVRKEEEIFKEKFKKIYGMDVNTVSTYFYDAINLYSLAVKKSKSIQTDDVKKSILSFKDVIGVRENYHLNEFGDGIRNMSLYIIKDNEFVLYKN